jgi:hypothetical protein
MSSWLVLILHFIIFNCSIIVCNVGSIFGYTSDASCNDNHCLICRVLCLIYGFINPTVITNKYVLMAGLYCYESQIFLIQTSALIPHFRYPFLFEVSQTLNTTSILSFISWHTSSASLCQQSTAFFHSVLTS